MIYTGKNIKADEAHRIGLVNKLFDSNDELLAASRKTLSLGLHLIKSDTRAM